MGVLMLKAPPPQKKKHKLLYSMHVGLHHVALSPDWAPKTYLPCSVVAMIQGDPVTSYKQGPIAPLAAVKKKHRYSFQKAIYRVINGSKL